MSSPSRPVSIPDQAPPRYGHSESASHNMLRKDGIAANNRIGNRSSSGSSRSWSTNLSMVDLCDSRPCFTRRWLVGVAHWAAMRGMMVDEQNDPDLEPLDVGFRSVTPHPVESRSTGIAPAKPRVGPVAIDPAMYWPYFEIDHQIRSLLAPASSVTP